MQRIGPNRRLAQHIQGWRGGFMVSTVMEVAKDMPYRLLRSKELVISICALPEVMTQIMHGVPIRYSSALLTTLWV